jgi:hypothetical protein
MGGNRIGRLARELPRVLGYEWGPRLMSWLRKRWVLLLHSHADIRFNGPVYLGPGFSLHIPRGGTFIVGAGVEFLVVTRPVPPHTVAVGAPANRIDYFGPPGRELSRARS